MMDFIEQAKMLGLPTEGLASILESCYSLGELDPDLDDFETILECHLIHDYPLPERWFKNQVFMELIEKLKIYLTLEEMQ